MKAVWLVFISLAGVATMATRTTSLATSLAAGTLSPDRQREGWYQNQALADLLLKALVTPDQAHREPMYKEADQMMHDDVDPCLAWLTTLRRSFSQPKSRLSAQPVDADNYEFVEYRQITDPIRLPV